MRRVQESAASAHRVRAMRPETIDKTVATEANRGVLAMAPPLSVSVCLSVCLSVRSRSYIEVVGRIEPVFGTEDYFYRSCGVF